MRKTAVWIALAVAVAATCACSRSGRPLIRQYEYEEEIFLALDGSATVVVNASVPALVALRGLDLDVNPRARLDRARVRTAFESSQVRITRVSRPWRRAGRRFIQVRLEVPSITELSKNPLFSWSNYQFRREGEAYVYRQVVGRSAGRRVDVGWNGNELVAFRLHLPSRILYHNARDLWRDNAPSEVERGNIVSWEQRLSDRLQGAPLVLELRLEPESILYRTLTLFGLAFAGAVAVLGAAIWWVVRKGKEPE
jgi:hypothetical protein